MSQMSDNLKKLAAAGKGDKARTLLREEAGRSHSRYEAIRRDESLSDQGKQKELAAAYLGMRVRVDREVAQMAARVVTADRDDASNVLGTNGIPGDAASLTISRRDAADRVAAVGTRDELGELLRRATRSGDEVLARAVAERALEDLDDRTMNQFLEDRPNLDAAAQRLWNARRADSGVFGDAVLTADLYPHELFGMDDGSISEIVHGAAKTGAVLG
ncbi:hypothetical protein [Nocardioides dongxiaopingii]|uniref:hypothetical protein n=1 Tax=Nocardioides dongxiaopingii TaxID=2576036 RepID=UPI0010C767C1|nr:hypothetical protein [Nocardioides dongxiaopingii]